MGRMITHRSERFGTENHEAEVALLENDRERFRVHYSIWKVDTWSIPFTSKSIVTSRKRVANNYYGRLHETFNLEDALEKFEECKDMAMARMEKREEHLEQLEDAAV